MTDEIIFATLNHAKEIDHLITRILEREDIVAHQRVRILIDIHELLTNLTRAVERLDQESFSDLTHALASSTSADNLEYL